MNRRTLLRRIGAAAAGTAAAVGGTASAERVEVEIDGTRYWARADLVRDRDPASIDTDSVLTCCESCDYDCDCGYCGDCVYDCDLCC